jgi:flagellar motor switch protein FliN
MTDEITPNDSLDDDAILGGSAAGGGTGEPPQKSQPHSIPADQLASPSSIDEEVERAMLEELAQAEAADATSAGLGSLPAAQPVEFDRFARTQPTGQPQNIEILLDVKLPVSIELGRTEMSIRDILDLSSGSVVELTKLAGEPVDLLVNNKVIARGEVVVVDENFGLRVTSLMSPEDRLKSL